LILDPAEFHAENCLVFKFLEGHNANPLERSFELRNKSKFDNTDTFNKRLIAESNLNNYEEKCNFIKIFNLNLY